MSGAACLEHPEREASGTCVRCGRFACASCLNARGACSNCDAKLAEERAEAGRLRGWLAVLLVLMVVEPLIQAAMIWMSVDLYGEDLKRTPVDHTFLIFGVVSSVGLLCSLVSLVALLARARAGRWILRAQQVVLTLNAATFCIPAALQGPWSDALGIAEVMAVVLFATVTSFLYVSRSPAVAARFDR